MLICLLKVSPVNAKLTLAFLRPSIYFFFSAMFTLAIVTQTTKFFLR